MRWPASVIVKVCPPNHLQEYFIPMRERNHVGYFATTSGSGSVKIVTNYSQNQLRAIENITERWKLPVRLLCYSYWLYTGWSKLTYLTQRFPLVPSGIHVGSFIPFECKCSVIGNYQHFFGEDTKDQARTNNVRK